MTIEEVTGTKDATISRKHHEQGGGAQIAFFNRVEKLFTVFIEISNPFEEESSS